MDADCGSKEPKNERRKHVYGSAHKRTDGNNVIVVMRFANWFCNKRLNNGHGAFGYDAEKKGGSRNNKNLLPEEQNDEQYRHGDLRYDEHFPRA